ncbi:MAG: hypothetical protein ACI841_003917 [Planctomycetota bacterium]
MATTIWGRVKGYDQVEKTVELDLTADGSTLHDLELPAVLIIVGTVRDKETNAAIPFAEVWTSAFDYEEDATAATTLANAEGEFCLEGVERDEHIYKGHRYLTLRLMGRAPGPIASPLNAYTGVPDAEGVIRKDLHLVPSYYSMSAVLYQPGKRAIAQAYDVWTVDSEMNFEFQTTTGRGEISIEGLPAGGLAIACYRNGRRGDGGHLSLSAALELLSGSDDRFEVELVSAGSTSIESFVRDPQGNGLAAVEVDARLDLLFHALRIVLDGETVRTDETGASRFEQLRAGDYRVKVAGCVEPQDRIFTLVFGESLTELAFVKGRCVPFSGTVDMGDHPKGGFCSASASSAERRGSARHGCRRRG